MCIRVQMEAGDTEKHTVEISLYVLLSLRFAPSERSIFCFSGALGLIAALQNDMRHGLMNYTHILPMY